MARAYRTFIIESTRGASRRFELMLAEYSVHPVIFRNRLIQDTLQMVFGGNVKTFYLTPGTKTLYLELDR